MTLDIERLAREADHDFGNADGLLSDSLCGTEAIKRFAALVLEEAAKVCEELDVPWSCSTVEKSLWDVATTSAADAIRALKGEK
jgi:hypothetical protein